MIPVTRLNQERFLINPDRIEYIEVTPDTVVTFESGRKVVVIESVEEIQEEIIAYRRAIYLGIPLASSAKA